jgi:hypothetical protein
MTSSSSDSRFALLCSGALVSLAFRLWQAQLENLSSVLLGWLLGLCLGLWLWLLCTWLEREAVLARPSRIAFFALFTPLLVLDLAYTFFLDTALERRLSLLDVGGAGIAYFFAHVLPPAGLALLVSLLGLVLWTGRFVRRLTFRWPLKLSWALTLALTVLLSGSAVRAERVAHPFADVCRDLLELVTTPHLTPSPQRPARFASLSLDRSQEPWPTALDTPFKKVLVFVLESTTVRAFEEQRKVLPNTTFARAAEPHLHTYERYFTGNQDSRTGMLGMLSARLNPLEAYTDLDVAGYRQLARGASLVGRMNALGYATAFAVSQLELELVVEDLPWQELISFSEQERKAAGARFSCLAPYEFEHSCEDLSLLPKVLDFLDRHERAFLYQEFIWGHSWHYNAALGQSNAQYYSGYIDAVLAHLRERGELEQTLVVVVSDHGPREHDVTRDIETYHIPLWFYSPRFQARADARLLSHLDFSRILLSELSQGAVTLEPEPFVLITGPTNSSLWAAVTGAGDFMLVKSRGSVHLMLEHVNTERGKLGPPADPGMASDILRLREDYKRAFSSAGAASSVANSR